MGDRCPFCGGPPEYLIAVWEDIEDHDEGKRPDYIGCERCHKMGPPVADRSDSVPEFAEPTMSDEDTSNADSNDRSVVDETINAYRVQKLSDGTVRLQAGGHVVHGDTYFDALEQYAQSEAANIETLPEHLRHDHRDRIHDGVIPLKSMDSTGFTPVEILDAVCGQPTTTIIDDLGRDYEHREHCGCVRCTTDHRPESEIPDRTGDPILDEVLEAADAIEAQQQRGENDG